MFLPLVFCVFFLQNVFGVPMLEMAETDEDPDWLPRYSRDFEIFDSDHWYKWWYGGKRKSTVQERITTLETRQKVLFDLVLCESHNRIRTFITDECELFRKKAEQVFGTPAKDIPAQDGSKVKPPSVTVSSQPVVIVSEAITVPQVITTTTQVTTIPQEVTTVAPTTISSDVTPVA